MGGYELTKIKAAIKGESHNFQILLSLAEAKIKMPVETFLILGFREASL